MANGYDTVVVGAGILGLAVARELLARRPDARVIVVDQADVVGAHQTSHNSGVIHAGVYYAPGSLKARLCVEGAARMYEYCDSRGVGVERIGKLIIATSNAELEALDALEARARANGVPGIRRLAAEEIKEIEPHATGVAALHSPATGIVDFGAVCARMADDVREAGAELRLGWRVADVQLAGRGIRLVGPDGDGLEASRALFCAGLWSDRLAVRAGAPADPRILPFRGGYLRLRSERRALVRGLIYPVPDPALPFLGVHLTPRIDGDVVLGPSALLVASRQAYRLTTVDPADVRDTLTWPGTWRMAARWWRTGLQEMHLAASREAFARHAALYVPGLQGKDLEPGPAGIRAQAVGRGGKLIDDFVLSTTPRAVHVRNAPSPAATSSLALAERIVDAAERELG
ncbi:MAG: L-2-hydroxyglutarate oxidase [Actinomycetota bacterium]|nr:L-2-hydroxyglutarate oxidase [Actinomycetota bacterium]